MVVLALIACFAEFPQRVHAEGLVLPEGGLVDIVSSRASLVADVHVAVGDHVATRDELVELTRERSQNADQDYFANQLLSLVREASALAKESAAESNQADLRREQVRDEMRAARSAYRNLQRAKQSLQREHEAVAAKARAMSELVALGMAAKFSVLTEDAKLARLSGELNRADTELIRQRGNLDRLQLELARNDEAERARRSQAQAREQEHHRAALRVRDSRSEILRAPFAGRVVRVARRPGEFAPAGATVVRLARRGDPLQVRLYVPSAGLTELTVDQPVRLQYAAYPIERFGFAHGFIAHIADVPLPAGEAPVGPIDEALFEVRVTLGRQSILAEGREWPLRAEMRVGAEVVVARRTLAQRLLRPLRSS